MGRKKTSIIWKLSLGEFKKLCQNSKTISEMLNRFGIKNKGGNYKTILKRIDDEKIDISHIPLGLNSNKNRTFPCRSLPIENYLIINSNVDRGNIKRRLIRAGILKNECSICGLINIWNNKPIVMILDHINGISNDNRLENLRLVCPNCNSQLNTFCGRNKNISKGYLNSRKICPICNETKTKLAVCCHKCCSKNKRKLKCRPNKQVLLNDIKELGYCGTGRKYGVSDNAIRKWIK